MMFTNNENKFSVSMSVYLNDDANHFNVAINSIVNQTIIPSEIILVVDGPVSESLDYSIKKKINQIPFLKVIRLEKNHGHGEARRIGLENCSNEIVALMDSDDISLQDRFEKQLKAINNNISVVGGQIQEFDDDVNKVIGIRRVPMTDSEIKLFLKRRCPMNQMTVMFRKSSVVDSGGYLDWYNNEDYYLWVRMVLKGYNFINLNETLVKVRVNRKMYKRRGGFAYFRSEVKLQKFMYDKKLISINRFLLNSIIRFVIQVVLPNNVRRYVFVKIFRN